MKKIFDNDLRCPVCSNIIKNYSSNSTVIKCDDCGNIFTVKRNETEIDKEHSDKKILVFTKTEDDFEKIIERSFVEDDMISRYIFEKAEFNDIKQYYLPMYLFSGEISNIQYPTKKENAPNQQFTILTLANEDVEIPAYLKGVTTAIKCNTGSMRKFDTRYLAENEDIELYPHEVDEYSAWENSARKGIRENFKEDLKVAQIEDKNVLSDNDIITVGDNITIEKSAEPITVFAAFWYTSYTYDNVEYHLIMDGSGEIIKYSSPQDVEIAKKAARVEKAKKEFPISLTILIIATIVLCFVIGPFALIFFFIFFCYLGISGSMKKQALKKLIAKSRELKEADWQAIQNK